MIDNNVNTNLIFSWSFKKTLILSGLVFGAFLFWSVLYNPSTVFAGGIGSGGSGSGGTGGHQTSTGNAWAAYPVSGWGPTDGFRDGTSWITVQNTCRTGLSGQVANTVYIYAVLEGDGSAKGYNFWQPWSNITGAGQGWDWDGTQHRATTINWTDAQNAYNNLPAGIDKSGFQFDGGSGGNVAWFCWDYEPFEPPHGTIQTNKYFPNSKWPGDFSGMPAEINNAGACWAPQNSPGVICNNTDNPWALNNVTSIGSDNRNIISVNVPAGYRVTRTNNRAFTCNGANNTGTCFVRDVIAAANQTVHVDFWFEKIDQPPVGVIDSALCNATESKIKGWAYDPDFPSASIEIHIYVYRANGTLAGTVTDKADEYTAPVHYPGMGGFTNPPTVVTGNHHFNIDISEFDDAYTNRFDVYAIGTSSDEGEQDNTKTNTLLGTRYVGQCAMPECTTMAVDMVTGEEINPQVDQRFKVDFAITYNPGTKGAPLTRPRANFRIAEGPITTAIETYDYPYNVPSAIGPPRNYFKGPGGTGYVFSTPGERDLRGRLILNSTTLSNPYGGNIDVFCGDPNNPPILRVSYQPYFKVFGNDVRVGGKFQGGDCTAPLYQDATIIGRTMFTTDGEQYFSGASVELAAYALAEIHQFYTAGMKNSHWTISSGVPHNATPQNGLTFSNWPSDGNAPRGFNGSTPATPIGGSAPQTTGYGGESNIWRCIPNYWSYSNGVSSSGAVNVNATDPGVVKRNHPSSPSQAVTVNGGVLGNGIKRTIFIDGDAYIGNNIEYSTAARASVSDIPQFTLVVRGNLYISNGVTKLHGLYISLPRCPQLTPDCNPNNAVAAAYNDPSATGGKIYTCASIGTDNRPQRYSADQLFANCGNPLEINGAFIAKRIKLLRTNGTVIRATKQAQQINFSFHDTKESADSTGKECLNVADGADHGDWNNNYICVDPGQVSYFELEWVTAGGPILSESSSYSGYGAGSAKAIQRNNKTMRPGKICTPFYEPSEVWQFRDNYLCYRADRGIELEFHYTSMGRPGTGYRCDVFDSASAGSWDGDLWTPSNPAGDPHTWRDNALCQRILDPVDYNEPATSDNIAEVFNFSPELYLVAPAGFPVSSGSSTGNYDSIRTLPPLL